MIFPEFVDSLKLLGLSFQLRLNILSVENIFEVHPLSLESEPLVDGITDVAQSALPFLNLLSYFVDEARTHHSANSHNIILEFSNNIFDLLYNKAVFGLTVIENGKFAHSPATLNFVHLSFQLSFTLCIACLFLDILLMVHGVVVKHPL